MLKRYLFKKICSRCGIKKWKSKFAKDKSKKDGHSCWCKLDLNIATKKWRLDNLEKVNQN